MRALELAHRQSQNPERMLRTISQRVVISMLVFVWPRVTDATVDLSSGTYSSTYDCAEQSQNTPGWVTCDGISKSGGWTTALGAVEQITSAANFSDGAGGRGQRHWIGDGTNVASGVVSYSFLAPQQEIYVRWYVRFQTGLALAQSGGSHKFMYFNGTFCQGHASGCYLLMQPSNTLLVVAGTPYQTSGWGWNDLHGGKNSADGQWHCMEAHLKTNSAGTGVVQWWVDGALRLDKNNVDYRAPYGGFGGFTLPSNGVFVTVGGNDMYEDIDDVSISTTARMGCLKRMAPSPPENLKIL